MVKRRGMKAVRRTRPIAPRRWRAVSLALLLGACASGDRASVPDYRTTAPDRTRAPPIVLAPPGSYRERVIAAALSEWRFWGEQFNHRRGPKETDRAHAARIAEYWRLGTGQTVTNPRVGWSGAFVSYVLKRAGAGDHWPATGSHAYYLRRATENRARGTGVFWAHRLGEHAPRPGDLVCNALERGIDYDRQPDRNYASHCDIVVEVRRGSIDVIGGNLSNAVARRTLITDERGRLANPQPRAVDPAVRAWFAVIESRL
jgi:hypothetical protein